MQVKISAVKANRNNPRQIKDDKFKKLVQSIREFPEMLEKRPLVCFTDVDGKYVVLGGNMRLKASQEVGLKEIPIVLADDWTQEQKDEFLIKDNVGFGEWNWDDLANEWDVVKLNEWGLDVPNFDAEVLEAEEDDFDTTPPEEPITVLGDLYEIGEHRLLCGDSTDSDQLAKLMNGQKADMVFTDPPYGVNYQSNWRNNKSESKFDILQNDNKFLDFKPNLILYTKESSAWFIWTSHQVYPIWRDMYEDYYLNTIIWNKGKMGMGDLSSYGNNYEMALFCSKGKPKLKGERKKAIWEINVEAGSEYVHPTQKPISLSAYAIPDFIDENDLVLDLFLGSGSTMAASHQLKRKCYGMELDPKYCDVIVNRMIALDPSIEIKLNGKPFEKAH
jgi:site-specific DNA-methyltransferase (adenine-specific)